MGCCYSKEDDLTCFQCGNYYMSTTTVYRDRNGKCYVFCCYECQHNFFKENTFQSSNE